jgi:hypothetical protein
MNFEGTALGKLFFNHSDQNIYVSREMIALLTKPF